MIQNQKIDIKTLPRHHDYRGDIQMLMESCNVGSISIILSNKGTTRANHYHPIDEHTIFITEGELEYFERPVNSKEKPRRILLKIGDIYHTDANYEHTMYAPVQNAFMCFSKLSRNKDNYEKETIRFDYSLKDLYDNWKD